MAILPGLPTVTVQRIRYAAQVIDATTGIPGSSRTAASIEAQEEPWRPNGSIPRPDGETSNSTRLFVCAVEVLGATDQGTANARRPDRIVADSGLWEVRECIVAPAMPGIPAAWHAYCVRVRPDDTPDATGAP